MKKRISIIVAALALMAGCDVLQTATPAYVSANKQRLTTVAPWLQRDAAAHPESAQNEKDVLAAWGIEVAAQNRTATTQPAK